MQFTPRGMAIYSKATILPHYVWLGMEAAACALFALIAAGLKFFFP